MNTFHIHIKGRVQGVGFRPYVYKLARSFQLLGWVNNTLDGVHVEFNASERKATFFCKTLIENAPSLSIITDYHFSKKEAKHYKSFDIIQSEDAGQTNLLLSPDFAICKECTADLKQIEKRRHNYAFTTCTNCGPRYSITKKLPYDRETTTMDEFAMCPACQKEYNTPEDRRYYSQTNSCPGCSISLRLFDKNKNLLSLDQDQTLNKVAMLWGDGNIVAVKGIGGYLLTCDAINKEAVETLRKRKHRPAKPFALMYPDLSQLRGDAILREEEIKALKSPASPIVLLRRKHAVKKEIALEAIAPGLDQIGVMLPYTPLFHLLLQTFGKAIVATSGNVSNAPIVYQDEKALEVLSGIADFILTNNRKIVIAQDDSVVKFSPLSKRRIVIRRSRGIAPSYINGSLNFPKDTLLATGADLKSTFTLNHFKNCYTSQYIGDLESFDTQESYKTMLSHFLNLFEAPPGLILADKHPNYFSSCFAEDLANQYAVPVFKIQHHLAHFGAVLGENNLMDSSDSILGVIWDGTGFGADGHIWGGEFFLYKNYEFERAMHFDYFPFFLGNKMPKEPRISALALCAQVPEAEQLLKAKFSKTEWKVYQTLLKKDKQLQSSSLGRIFDAVASLLGLIDQSSYEGEAAMLLEALAWKYIDKHGLDFKKNYLVGVTEGKNIPTRKLIQGVLDDLEKGTDKAQIAATFHYSLICIIEQIAQNAKIQKIAFSGGVFQNSLLVDLIDHFLKHNFKLYFHKELSPNDENVSFGQLVCYQLQLKKTTSWIDHHY